MPANLGSTWNESLVTKVYALIGREARAAGVDYAFGPVLQVTKMLLGDGIRKHLVEEARQ